MSINHLNQRFSFTTISNKYWDEQNSYHLKNSLFDAFSNWLALNENEKDEWFLFTADDLKFMIKYPKDKEVNVFPLPENMEELKINSIDNYKAIITDVKSVSNDYYSILELCYILGVSVDFYNVHTYGTYEWITTPYVSINKEKNRTYNRSFSVARYNNKYELITSKTLLLVIFKIELLPSVLLL